MVSTYTSNTGIEKPATGDQSGTWGDTTNTNFDIVDRTLNGVGAITLSGTSHTLATTDGTLSDGMFKVLVLGGSPTGTNTAGTDGTGGGGAGGQSGPQAGKDGGSGIVIIRYSV